jgi:hypothetical protein
VRDLAAAWARENYEFMFMPATLPGDYNVDGSIDAADYVVWRDTFGSATDLRANGDNIGPSENVIDEADYVVWRANFGASRALSVPLAKQTSVPEPAAAANVVIAGLLIAYCSLRVRCHP